MAVSLKKKRRKSHYNFRKSPWRSEMVIHKSYPDLLADLALETKLGRMSGFADIII